MVNPIIESVTTRLGKSPMKSRLSEGTGGWKVGCELVHCRWVHDTASELGLPPQES